MTNDQKRAVSFFVATSIFFAIIPYFIMTHIPAPLPPLSGIPGGATASPAPYFTTFLFVYFDAFLIGIYYMFASLFLPDGILLHRPQNLTGIFRITWCIFFATTAIITIEVFFWFPS